ncbi:MAG: MMPL family transporter [Streptosporangiaceae bacterium]|nr:MMPL family transporter [Streptosporangiaceae bacterium]
MLGRIGAGCYRHRWATLLGWVVAVACLIMLWTRFGAAAQDTFTGSDPGQTLLNQHFARQSGDTLTLAIRSTDPIRSVEPRITGALAPFRDAAHVTGVSDLHVARDGHIAFATVQFDVTNAPTGEAKTLMADATKASGHGVTFALGGSAVDQAETPYGGASNGIGVGAAAVVLLIAFGSFLAMGLPIATALMGIGSGLSIIALLGHIFPAPSFSPIIAAMIGLGVGVDYALFIVTRFREELRNGNQPQDAIVTSMRTAGKSVLTAGTTVVIGMLGLLVLRQALMNGVAIAAAATVAMTVIASLTLLPALLGFSGMRLAGPSRFSRKQRHGTQTTARSSERWALVVQRHPVIAASLSAAFILILAAPALFMKLSMPDESAQARGTMGYASYATMVQGFGPGFDAPLIVTVRGASAGNLPAEIGHTPGIAAVTPPVTSTDHQATMFIAYPTTGEQDPATNALVNDLRAHVLPSVAYLTGPNAGNVSFANLVGQRLPWLIGVVVALSMLLLTAVFRSVTVAVKAAVMNLLSITAAYGVLTAITQWGWAGHLFGFPEKMPVTTWVPMFLFVILFGLSMDYEVFLLSRIREEWDATGDNARSVARGLASSARVITAAAAIMVVVFLSFVLTPDVSVKQIGLGLAAAVLIDATVVRLVLVPAVMELLGKANWWLPSWLGRLLPAPAAPAAGAGAHLLGADEPRVPVR